MHTLFRLIGDLGRLRETVTAFSGLGFAQFMFRMGLGWCMSVRCWIRCRLGGHACPVVDMPRQCRLVFERLGATYIKLGQVLSMRPDVVAPAYISEFRRLQEHAPPVAYADVERTIRADLKRSPNELYARFDPEPIAAASLGQVHRARLRDGTEVAVKVQRPHVRQLLLRDLRILEFIVRRMEERLPEFRQLRPMSALKTFRESLMNEIDYRIEARNADRYAYQLRNETGVKIPRIFWEYTTAHVLTMEFVRGIRMGDAEALKAKGIEHGAVLRNCMRGCLIPIFLDGFFHADPHPGNVWVQENGEICYLDFGMMGSLAREERRDLLLLILFLSEEHIDSAIYYLLKLCEVTGSADVESYRQEVISMVTSYYQHPEQKTATETLNGILHAGARHGIYFPPGMVMLAKALMTCESMCRMTHGNMDFLKHARPLLREIALREFGPMNVLREFEKSLPEIAAMLSRLPGVLQGALNGVVSQPATGRDDRH